MRLLADENMPMVDALFGGVAESIVYRPGRAISQADLVDIDVLLVRSVTQVNAALLANTSVKFVGTATIGTDHLDIPWLTSQGIAWHSSPGCNANAVVDYVIAALCYHQQISGQPWRHKTLGIIGCGNVGGRLAGRLRAAGVDVLCYDPPRQQATPGSQDAYCSWDQVLTADILCLHTPLTRTGPYPSYHMLNAAAIDRLKPGAVVINAGRGAVIDEAALKHRLRRQQDLDLILDVFETEPNPDPDLLAACLIATPHIAGYSLDGKIRGTWMLHLALMQWLGHSGLPQPQSDLQWPAPYIWRSDWTVEDNLYQATLRVFSVEQDAANLLAALSGVTDAAARGLGFDGLRKGYPVRREFSCLQLRDVPEAERPFVQALGFQCPS